MKSSGEKHHIQIKMVNNLIQTIQQHFAARKVANLNPQLAVDF